MTIQRNHHVLAVPDAPTTAQWFVDVLGFELSYSEGGWRFVRRDNVTVMLGSCPDAIAPSELGDHQYFAYFVVDDVDTWYAQVVERGGRPPVEPVSKPWGMREFGVTTPDGHRLMVGQILDATGETP